VSCSIFSCLVSLLLLSTAATAQNTPKAKLSYKLISVHVMGANRLTSERIVAASGLKIGQFAGENEFKASLQKLGETGLFIELTYSYKYSAAGCALEFQVTENDKLVPIVFENFVWFADDELLNLLRARVPLFDGALPMGGELPDQVADQLNAILAERKISGKTEYERAAKRDGPIDSYVYKVNFRPILVRKVSFPGALPAELPALQDAAKALSGQDYWRTKMLYQEKLTFLPVYHARGYLKASFADAQAKVAEDGAQTLVDVSFPVTPGLQYKLAEIQWAGNTALTLDKLQNLIKLKPGEPANAIELDNELNDIHKLYGTKGYLFAQVDASPEMDDSQATVRYQLNVTEGDQFHMGELIIDGLDPDSSKKMAAQWQMKVGDPFDDSYMSRFFKVMYRDIGLHGGWSVVPKQSVSQQDKTVSVTLHFMPKA
jgi:outer membrane protein insertion porin family